MEILTKYTMCTRRESKITILILLTTIFCQVVNARTISEREAIQRALTFLNVKGRYATIQQFSLSGKAEMYIVTTNNSWALLSTETSTIPVLAFARDGNFPPIGDMPDGMKWLFSYYEDVIYYAKQQEQELSHINTWAEDELNENSKSSIDTVYLTRFDSIAWGQYWNNSLYSSCDRTYNKFCPDFYSLWCNKTYAGCGAVALGQVLWYYKWPYAGHIPKQMLDEHGTVSTDKEFKFYNWDLMPGAIMSNTPIEEVDEIAALLRDCGYAEEMEYGSNASSTYLSKIGSALYNNFSYISPQGYQRLLYVGNWIERMKDEIRNGRPVIYRGENANGGGHFFVLHGFENDYFKINWGWRGEYNNVMCTLNALYYNPPSAHYNNGQWALINIQPSYPTCTDITVPSTDVWDNNFLIQNGGGITVGNRTITGFMQGGILSGEYVKLSYGFKTTAGAKLYVAVKDMHCDDQRGETILNDTPSYAPIQRKHTIQNGYLSPCKLLRNGQILILRGDKTYTITGTEVQ